MGIKEILAAKAAAAAAAAAPVEKKEDPIVSVVNAMVAEIPQQLEAPAPVEAPAKPLTFAEKMALKRAQQATAPAPAPTVVSPISLPELSETSEKEEEEKKEEAEDYIDPANLPSDPAVANAFIDIVRKARKLRTLMGDALENGMKDLKKALKENPAACELMLDEDLGRMVVALRRMKGEQLAEATSGKKATGKKNTAKETKLTREEIEAAMAEI